MTVQEYGEMEDTLTIVLYNPDPAWSVLTHGMSVSIMVYKRAKIFAKKRRNPILGFLHTFHWQIKLILIIDRYLADLVSYLLRKSYRHMDD